MIILATFYANDRTKLKAFADDKFSVTKMTIPFLDGVVNTGGRGEDASYQLSQTM